MADCAPFRIHVGDQLTDLIPVLLQQMTARGATARGDHDHGSFFIPLPIGGTVQGRYEVDGQSIVVAISSRPAVVSCGTIESKLQDFILDAKALLKNQRRPS